ncbi:MAG: hypothetical protein ACPGWR_06220, partial [Ardenticatenaceae bacterium]
MRRYLLPKAPASPRHEKTIKDHERVIDSPLTAHGVVMACVMGLSWGIDGVLVDGRGEREGSWHTSATYSPSINL